MTQRVRSRLGLEKKRARATEVESRLKSHGRRLKEYDRRLQRYDDRLKTQRALIDKQQEQFDNQRQRARKQQEHMTALAERVESAERKASMVSTVYTVLECQIASMETRLEDLLLRADGPIPASTDADRTEARRLVDDIRDEHSRIRARFGIMARYEERIRRLEAALKPVPGA